MISSKRSSFAAALAAAVLAFGLGTGCGSDDGPTAPGPGAPSDTFPPATSPSGAANRLFSTYQAENALSYGLTLTTDFRFHFSAESDPQLVSKYGDSWGHELEVTSASHLFTGFTNDSLEFQVPAIQVTVDVPFMQEVADPTHPDSTVHYRRIALPRVMVNIVLSDSRDFVVDQPADVYVVRGDAARLAPGQSPDSTRWYVRQLDDLSSAIVVTRDSRLKPANPTTWGSIRDSYAARLPQVNE
jgi:hypothetical protein